MQTLSAEQFKKQYGDQTYQTLQQTNPQKPKEPGLFQRIGQDLKSTATQSSDIYDQGASGQISPIRAATGVVANDFNAIPKIASELLPKPVRQGIDAVGGGIGKGLQWVAEKTTPQFLVDFVTKHPDAAKMLENAAGTLSNTGQIAGDILATDQATKGIQKGVDLTKQAGQKVGQGIQNTAQTISEKAKQLPTNLRSVYKNNDSFVKNLVTPELKGNKLLQAVKTGKVKEGSGLTGQRDITGAMNNLDDIEAAVKEVPGVSPSKTNLENLNAIHDEIGNLANTLEQQVGKERSFFSPNKFKSVMNGAKSRLSEDPTLVGDAATTSGKVISKFEQLVQQEGYTSSGLLSARKLLDQWISKYKPKVFNPATESGITSAVREIRQTGNQFLSDISPNSAVKELLGKQSTLYRAIDNIAPKAVKEGSSALQQIIKANPIASRIVKTAGHAAGLGVGVKLGEDIIP